MTTFPTPFPVALEKLQLHPLPPSPLGSDPCRPLLPQPLPEIPAPNHSQAWLCPLAHPKQELLRMKMWRKELQPEPQNTTKVWSNTRIEENHEVNSGSSPAQIPSGCPRALEPEHPRAPRYLQQSWGLWLQSQPTTGQGRGKKHMEQNNPSSETSPFPFHAGTWLQRHLVLPGIQHTQEQQEEPSPNTTTRAQRKRGRPCPKPGGTNLQVRDKEMLLFQGFGQ